MSEHVEAVKRILNRVANCLEPEDYELLNNVIVPWANNQTATLTVVRRSNRINELLEANTREVNRKRAVEARTIRRIQSEVEAWLAHNFPKATAEQQALGALEELGELTEAVLLAEGLASIGKVHHSLLKYLQGIRGKNREERWDKLADAIGDHQIFFIGMCALLDLDLEAVLIETWEQVKARDWQKDHVNGGE